MTGALLFKNPRLLLLLIGVIAVAGLTSYTTLPRMEDPILVQRFGVIRTIFPGADAERVESQISRPLEEDIRKIKGIKEIRTDSMAGLSTVGIELKEDITDVDTVWSRVRDELSETAKRLPEGARQPDFKQPELRAYASILALKWTGSGEANYSILRRLTEDLKAEIRALSGTESVGLFGQPEEEILVEIPRDVLHRMGLTIGDISRQIKESEAKGSSGMLRSDDSELVIELDQDFDTLKRVGTTPIRYGEEGRLTSLEEIAEIQKTIENPPSNRAVVDGLDAVVTAAFVREESRIDLWTREHDEVLETFRETLPPGVELDVLFTQNIYVEDRLEQLGMNLLIGTLAVTLVVFVLMGWRSMVVVGIALPLSAMIVLAGMRFLEIPIHQMSVTGLIIALGLLIDNAIVMVDEVSAEIRDGKTPYEAILKTIRHLALPLFGSTLTTTLAFAPIAMLPGASGEFVGSIAVSVILAINSSFLLAMSVVPALAGLINKVAQQSPASESTGYGFWSKGIGNEKAAKGYRWILIRLFRVPVIGVLLGVSLPIFGFFQAKKLPEQFFPPASRDQIQIELELSASSSIEQTGEVARKIRNSALEFEGVKRVHWFLGESAPTFYYNLMPRRKNSAFYAQALVEFEKDVDSFEMIRQLQDKFDVQFPEARILVRQLEQGPAFDAPVEVKIFGPDLAVLQKLGNEVRVLMTETRDVVHTRSDLTEMVPKLALHLDEYQTRMSGLSHKEIEQQLYSSLEGLESGSLIEDTEEIPIRVRMEGDARKDTGRISSFELRPLTPRGRAQNATPLSALGEMNLSSEVASIPRIDGKRTNEIKAYITAGTLPHLVITEFKQKLEDSGFTLPPGYSMEYGGEAAKRDEAVGNLMSDIPLLIMLMIATLVASFRSFRVAFIVAVVGGLSVGLGLGALWAFRFPFGFMGVVGTMGLVGVAVNDAIVVMAGIRDNKSARAGVPEAIADIVIRRTRHIVATSLTTMVGFTPLVLGGGGFWPPVAITIAAGVGGATMLALFFVPSFYLLFIGRGINPTLEAPIPAASPRSAKPGPRIHSRISPQRLRKSRTKARKR